ncbi:MAG TPA: zinc metalloprotease HtpX [Candidatus Obscuribacterales bacterium]
MNTLRTIVLMGFLTALMVGVGGFIGGKSGLIIAFIFALVTNFTSYWFSDKIAIMMAGAQPVSEQESPELYDIVRGLCQKAGLPMPRIYIDPSQSPNAFATGRDPEHAAVAVTVGIMQILNRDELEAVLAHELGHVRNRDVLITTIASVFAAVITGLAHMVWWGGGFRNRDDDRGGGGNLIGLILVAVLAPLAASLINLAISRSREYQADQTGAEICGHPEALANALAKLEQGSQRIPMGVNPALGNMYTVKPDPGNWFTNIMSTHPPIPERINRLEEMAVRKNTI